jgi:hypothetical protein
MQYCICTALATWIFATVEEFETAECGEAEADDGEAD